MAHSATLPAVALLLAGRRTFSAVLIIVAAGLIALVGGSRATIVLYGSGVILTTLLSARYRISARTMSFGIVALLGLIVIAPVMKWAIDRRSVEARVSSNEERAALIDAAEMMIGDHPLGVGANQYVLVANIGGYSDRAGVSWFHESRSAPVHNSYLMVLAELGWLGFFGMVSLLGSFIIIGFRALRMRLPSEQGDLFVGVLAALIVVSIHSAFEWITMDFRMHYMIAMDMGLLIGLLHYAPPPRRKRSGVRRAALGETAQHRDAAAVTV